MLDKNQICSADDLPRETVDVPEWGGKLFIRGLTSAERDDYELAILNPEFHDKGVKAHWNMKNTKARLVALCLESAPGERVFSDTAEGEKVLGDKSAGVVARLYEVAQRLSGLSAEDVKELEKNC